MIAEASTEAFALHALLARNCNSNTKIANGYECILGLWVNNCSISAIQIYPIFDKCIHYYCLSLGKKEQIMEAISNTK